MSDPALLAIAEDLTGSEAVRSIPVRQRRTLEDALMTADAAKDRLRPDLAREGVRELARIGGRARKPDTLQVLIEELVRRRPSLTASGLLESLEAAAGDGVIDDIVGGKINFVTGIHPVTKDGRSKSAPTSALKDRLTRARETVRKTRSR